MVFLCFVLDLQSLSPMLLGDLKQSLLQLANYYSISSSSHQSSLGDRIGLCHVFRNRISGSDELKVAYNPIGNFNLRDFHHAVNNFPSDAFSPDINDSGAFASRDMKLSSVLSDQILYSWGGKDIMKKVIVLSSCLPENLDPALRQTLTDAEDKCVSIEFVLFEQKWSHLNNVQENINTFIRNVSDLDNCSLQTYLADDKVLHGLVRRWLQDLKDDMEEPLQARFIFKSNLIGSINQIICNLSTSVNQIIDGFSPCQTCRCHGVLLDVDKKRVKTHSCPITGHNLGSYEVIENSVKVGDKTILFMPTVQRVQKLQKVSSPIDFNIIEMTKLGSLNEGLIIGASYVVTPSSCHETETSSTEIDQTELNAQLFQGLSSALHLKDQGLLCSSTCNLETMRATSFCCYYILLPSNKGPMLLRRLAGSEEVLPVHDVGQLIDSSVTKEVSYSIEVSLSEMEPRDYNPLLHERGFHQKLNLLVKESLQLGSILGQSNEETSEVIPALPDSSELMISQPNEETSEVIPSLPDYTELISQPNTTIDAEVVGREIPPLNLTDKDDNTAASIAEEWEQLVVHEKFIKNSPICTAKPMSEQSVISPVCESPKQVDVKTSRILERLEVPKQLKTKVISPTITTNHINSLWGTGFPTKKPLVPFQQSNYASDKLVTSSQLMKPSFQRLKRKHV